MLRLLLVHRSVRRLHEICKEGKPDAWLARLALMLLAVPKWWAEIAAKSQFSNDIEIDDGVCFSDDGHIFFGAISTGTGTVIGPRVTVGSSHIDAGRPRLGHNVWIGSDCVLYGAISIGDGATVLPGTVLTKSIPPGAVVQGNPARLVTRQFDNAQLRARGDAAALASLTTCLGR